MKLRIPYWPKRRLIIEVRTVRMIRMAEHLKSEYVVTACESAGFEITTSKRRENTNERS